MAFLGILVPLFVVGLIVTAAVAVMRARAGNGHGITFPVILLAYVSTAMFISIFLVAVGSALLIKPALGGIIGTDFSYNNEPQRRYSGESSLTETWVDPSDDAIRNDVAAGVTLVFVGVALFALHGVAAAVLRRRQAQGERLISRAYNLLGLAMASIGFLGGGGSAVHDVLKRYLLDTGGPHSWEWETPHPGGSLAVAIVFLPLAVWFGWRVWQEFALEAPAESGPDADT
jgi:hypothetical protein